MRSSSEGYAALELGPGSPTDIHAGAAGMFLHRCEEPGLADTGGTNHHRKAGSSAKNSADERVQSGELAVAL